MHVKQTSRQICQARERTQFSFRRTTLVCPNKITSRISQSPELLQSRHTTTFRIVCLDPALVSLSFSSSQCRPTGRTNRPRKSSPVASDTSPTTHRRRRSGILRLTTSNPRRYGIEYCFQQEEAHVAAQSVEIAPELGVRRLVPTEFRPVLNMSLRD